MGLVSFSLIFPVLLFLAFFAGRLDRGWRITGRRSFVIACTAALLLVAGMLFLPTYQWINQVVSPFTPPFDAVYNALLYLAPILALILAAFFLYDGLALMAQKPGDKGENGAGRAITSLILSGLLYGSALHTWYWQFIWDKTTNPWEIYLLFGPFMAVLISGILLSNMLRGRDKWYGFSYTVILAAAVLSVYGTAQKTDYHQLTDTHAAAVTRAIDSYYAREGHYPQSLHQLVPWTMLSLPKPVIMHGQDWCYQSGDDYYRFGYVSREVWFSPHLNVMVYSSAGSTPDVPELCASETQAILASDSMFRVIR